MVAKPHGKCKKKVLKKKKNVKNGHQNKSHSQVVMNIMKVQVAEFPTLSENT